MTYDASIKWAKKRLTQIESDKKDVITQLADRLEADKMEASHICAYICKKLASEGFVSDRYIRAVLKDTKFIRKIAKGNSSEVVPDSETEESSTNENEGDQTIPPMTIGTDGNIIPNNTEIPLDKTDKLDSLTDKKDESENPKEIEIQFLKDENSFLKEKVSELEDALKKTQQFTPATDLEEVVKTGEQRDKEAHDWLRNSADGIGTFYYDAYGIDLFKNRELSQLKNSGVKTFKRLYFEV